MGLVDESKERKGNGMKYGESERENYHIDCWLATSPVLSQSILKSAALCASVCVSELCVHCISCDLYWLYRAHLSMYAERWITMAAIVVVNLHTHTRAHKN